MCETLLSHFLNCHSSESSFKIFIAERVRFLHVNECNTMDALKERLKKSAAFSFSQRFLQPIAAKICYKSLEAQLDNTLYILVNVKQNLPFRLGAYFQHPCDLHSCWITSTEQGKAQTYLTTEFLEKVKVYRCAASVRL